VGHRQCGAELKKRACAADCGDRRRRRRRSERVPSHPVFSSDPSSGWGQRPEYPMAGLPPTTWSGRRGDPGATWSDRPRKVATTPRERERERFKFRSASARVPDRQWFNFWNEITCGVRFLEISSWTMIQLTEMRMWIWYHVSMCNGLERAVCLLFSWPCPDMDL
jgi:hypothetical protein